MKKAISIILNVLSIISAAVLLIFAAFCVYDWIIISKTPYAYSIDFWVVIDLYAVGMLSSSLAGLVFAVPNIFVSLSEKIKKTAKILTITFGAAAIVSVVLYILPIYF